MALLGLDLGTQSLKAVVLADDLRVLGTGAAGYRPAFPRPGWAEQDANDWLAALRPAIAAALDAARCRPEQIEALAIFGQLDVCVPTDAGLVRERAGLVLDATHMAAKIAWLQRERGAAATWHQPVSFLLAALTGQ